jgi:hypothetical protein
MFRKHLFSDIQPYVCVVLECNYANTPFSTKNEWENHVAAEHDSLQTSEGLNCPICQDNLRKPPIQIRSHIARHLEEIALTILPTNPDSEDGTDVDSGLASSASNFQSHVDDEAPEIEYSHTDTTPITHGLERIQNELLDPLIRNTDLRVFHGCVSSIREELHLGMSLREVEVLLISRAEVSGLSPSKWACF